MPQIFDKMQAVYDAIDERQDAKNAERVAERKLHVATGSNEIGEMLWNGLKRGGDEFLNQCQKSGYYNDDVKEQIKLEYKNICFTMVDSFAEALWDTEHIDLRDPRSGEDYKRTYAMFENLRANKIPESRVDEVALEIFEKNPIVPDFLQWAVARYGDTDGEMQKIADAFHVSIQSTKQELLKRVFDALDFSSEKTTLASKETLKKEEERLQYSDDEFNAVIENHLIEFDRLARTVDEVEYKTREEAKKASELYAYFKKLDLSTEEAAEKAKTDFKEQEKKTGLTVSKLEKKLDSKLQKFDKEARTVNEVVYKTRDDAKKASTLLDLFQTLKLEKESDAVQAKEIFSAKEKELGLTLPECEEKINSVLSAMDQEAKTFDGKEFATREEAAEARKQFSELQKLIVDIGYDTVEKTQNLIRQIETKKYSIPQAQDVLTRLNIHKEIAQYLPIEKIELYRMLMSAKSKGIVAAALFIV